MADQPVADTADPFGANEPVSVVDTIAVRPGQRQAVIDLFERVYKPMAAERGLGFVALSLQPPFERRDTGGEIQIHWQYPSLGALWGARGVEETDPQLPAFWGDLAPLIENRTRKLSRPGLMAVDSFQGPPAVPMVNTAGSRAIAFLRPENDVEPGEWPQWVERLHGLAGKDGIRGSYAGFNQGGYTGRPGEITLDLVFDDHRTDVSLEQLQSLVPVSAQVDEVVVPGPCLAWGYAEKPMADAVKRTILLKVRDDVSASDIQIMEQTLIEWAQQLPEMATWSLSRIAHSSGPVQWSHCYEQEFTIASAVVGSYLNHPFHWSVADRYFHPEGHEQVANVFFHSIHAISESILVPILGN